MASIGRVVAELGLDNKDFQAKLRQTTTDVKRSSAAWSAGFDAAAKKSAKASQQVGDAGRNMGQQFAGAGSAISGVSAALTGLGAPGGAISAVSGAIASLMTSGIGGISVALAAATAGFTLFFSKIAEGSTVVQEIEKDIKSLTDRVKELRTIRQLTSELGREPTSDEVELKNLDKRIARLKALRMQEESMRDLFLQAPERFMRIYPEAEELLRSWRDAAGLQTELEALLEKRVKLQQKMSEEVKTTAAIQETQGKQEDERLKRLKESISKFSVDDQSATFAYDRQLAVAKAELANRREVIALESKLQEIITGKPISDYDQATEGTGKYLKTLEYVIKKEQERLDIAQEVLKIVSEDRKKEELTKEISLLEKIAKTSDTRLRDLKVEAEQLGNMLTLKRKIAFMEVDAAERQKAATAAAKEKQDDLDREQAHLEGKINLEDKIREAAQSARNQTADIGVTGAALQGQQLMRELDRLVREGLEGGAATGEINELENAYADLIGKIHEFEKAQEKANQKLSESQQFIKDVGDSLASDLSNNLADAVLEARSLSDALKEVGRNLIRLVVQKAIQGAVTGGFGLLGLPGFATGGSFKVGGTGGIDSQTVAFRATPGEMVNVSRPGKGSGETSVVIHNYSDSQASVQKRTGVGGKEELQVIIGAVADDIHRGGKVSQAINSRNGTRRRGRNV